MNKKTVKSLIAWGVIILIIAVAVILLVTVVNKKTVIPTFQTDATGKTLLVYNGTDKEVVIPKEITLIGNGAFENNSTITKVSFESGSKIKNIARYSFKSCVNLKEVKLPNTLEKISYGAFEDCMRLEKVVIPSSVKTIEDNAFSGCSSLEEIDLKEGIETIGNKAFAETAISTLYFPSSIQSFGEGVFTGCDQLDELEIATNSTLFSCDNGVLYLNNEDGTKEIIVVLKTYISDFTVDSSVSKIHRQASNSL